MTKPRKPIQPAIIGTKCQNKKRTTDTGKTQILPNIILKASYVKVTNTKSTKPIRHERKPFISFKNGEEPKILHKGAHFYKNCFKLRSRAKKERNFSLEKELVVSSIKLCDKKSKKTRSKPKYSLIVFENKSHKVRVTNSYKLEQQTYLNYTPKERQLVSLLTIISDKNHSGQFDPPLIKLNAKATRKNNK